MTVTTRRTASTETIHHLWDAIVYARQQKQIPNMERISNYMRRKHSTFTGDELEKQLRCAVQDILIDIKKVVGCKGSKVGIEQDSFRIPENDVEKDEHDWYCFGCHKEGKIIFCSTCHRVYHEDCLKEPPVNDEKLICDVCKMIKLKENLRLNRDDLNLLLKYACVRMRDKVMTNRDWPKTQPTEEEKWRHNLLIYENMDLTIIDDKTENNEYRSLAEFQADAQTLVHNVVIYHGVHSSLADSARQMLRDCCYDLSEIRQCKDCYRTSNEKRDRYWFCQPCDPAHDLVYAKQKGFSFWPAKVIRIHNGQYDVRFFGGSHQRANIEKENIKPITMSLQQIQTKRTAALNKALEELKRHQQLLGQPPKEKKSKQSSSRSSSANSRSRKSSVSSEEDGSENEAEDGNSSQDECPSSSSPKVPRFKDAPTPEDHNVVSSSCQESSPSPKVTVSTQTHKKLLASLIPKPPKPEVKEPEPCNCEQKYSKMFQEFKERLEAEQKEEKDRSLRELAERLRQDFEEEKQRVVTAAVEKIQLETTEAKRMSEENLRNSQQMEMAEVIERHSGEISEIKKKQWCYNCEAEAIYHCCWNTSYCSVDCQQVHWHKEHKRTCRRKR